MFKRAFWMSTGMVVGAGGAFWAKRRVEQTVERYLPEQVAERAATSARNLGQAVREAAAEGREVMRDTEAELRSRVQERTFVGGAATASTPRPSSGAPHRSAAPRSRHAHRRRRT